MHAFARSLLAEYTQFFRAMARMVAQTGRANIASDTLPLAVVPQSEGPDLIVGAEVRPAGGESASISIGADETRPDDEESIGADDSASAVEESTMSSSGGRVRRAVADENSTNVGYVLYEGGGRVLTRGGSRLLAGAVIVWLACMALRNIGKLVVDIRRAW